MSLVDYHIGLTLLFMAAFFVMVVWVFWPSRRGSYQNIAKRVLEDDPATSAKNAQSRQRSKGHE